MYYWDGQRWLTTLSSDGRARWDGTAWSPLSASAGAAASGQPLEPSSWTAPLQLAVILFYGLQAFFAATVPFWFISTMTRWADAMNARNGPQPTPPPDVQASVTTMNDVATVVLYAGVVVAIVVALAAIVAAVRRSTWAFYAIGALLGVQVMFSLFGLLNVLVPTLIAGVAPPAPVLVPELSIAILGGALLSSMIVARVTRGPWGMRPPRLVS